MDALTSSSTDSLQCRGNYSSRSARKPLAQQAGSQSFAASEVVLKRAKSATRGQPQTSHSSKAHINCEFSARV